MSITEKKAKGGREGTKKKKRKKKRNIWEDNDTYGYL